MTICNGPTADHRKQAFGIAGGFEPEVRCGIGDAVALGGIHIPRG